MKSNIMKLTLFAILITGLMMSCNESPGERVEEAEENVVKAQQELEEARQDSIEYVSYRSDAERKLDANDQKIADLKQRKRTASKEVEDQYDREIEALDKRNKELRDNIDTYQSAGRDRWESFKYSFNENMNDLENSISNLFKKDTLN